MKRSLQRQPKFDTLESIQLQSGLAGSTIAAAAPNPLHLAGSIRIHIKVHLPTVSENGTGSLSPLGHVKVSGGVELAGSSDDSEPPIILKSKAGEVFVTAVNSTTSGDRFVGQYTITGGTGAFANETGTGTIVLTLHQHNREFTATFS